MGPEWVFFPGFVALILPKLYLILISQNGFFTMNKKEMEGLNHIRSKKEVQRALKESRRKKRGVKVVATTADKISIATHVLILLGLAILKYILKIGAFLDLKLLNDLLPEQLQLSEKLVEGMMTVVLLLTIAKFIKVIVINGIEDTSTKYNLQRILNLLVGIILFFIVISILFANWYTAVVSLGLISLILGFALQQPITSFIAWIHIIITRPYRVGDRIKMGEAVGDVIDIGYLETTVWESVGESLSSEFPSGRIIRFPNSSVLGNPVFNYSWPLFPYMWDEVRFFISFGSDISFALEIMKKSTQLEMGDTLTRDIHLYRELLKETPVDIEQIVEKPIVSLRVHENNWIEIKTRYLVDPREAGTVKDKLVERILLEFKKNPQKIMLPLGTER